MSIFNKRISFAMVLITIFIAIASSLSFAGMRVNAQEFDFSPIFDSQFYADKYEDLYEAFGYNEQLLFAHFIKVGMDEGRQASEEFDVKSYRARYQDLRKMYGDNLRLYYFQYLFYGKDEGRNGVYFDKFNEREFFYTTKAYDDASSNVVRQDVVDYYDKAVFVGDSIMTGFCYYATSISASCVVSSDFLAQNSYAVYHAIKPLEEDEHQPIYQGVKDNIWNIIPNLDVDKVFIMFGTNDLVIYSPETVCEKYLELINILKEKNPDIDIYVISMTSTYPGINKNSLNNQGVAWMNTYMGMQAPYLGYKYLNLNKYVCDEKYDLKKDLCSDNYVHHTFASYKYCWEQAFTDFAIREITLERIGQ